MSGSVADNIYPHSKDGVAQAGSEDGHFQTQSSFAFPKVFPLMRCINKLEAITLPNCPCAYFTIQNLSQVNEIRWGRNTADEAPFIDRNYVGDSRGGIIYPRQTVQLPFLNTNVISVAGEEDTEFQLIATVNTTADPIIDTAQPPEITYPQVLTTTPVGGVTTASRNNNIEITFDQAIDPTTVTTANITISPSIAFTVALHGTIPERIIINPTGVLLPSTLYTISLSSAIRDVEGHRVYPAYSFSFVTQPATVVTSNTPANTATNVERNVDIEVTFSTEINIATVNATTFAITPSVAASRVKDSVDPLKLILNPTADLAASTTYTINITAGMMDTDTNSVTPFSFTFTTKAAGPPPDTTPPTVVSRTPTNGSTAVLVTTNGTITFSEALAPATVNNTNCVIIRTSDSLNQAATVTLSADGKTVTIDPTVNLAHNTGFTLRATTGVTDVAGNPLAVASDSTFTTTVLTAPTVSSRSPTAGATSVAIAVSPTLTFSEAMSPASINNTTCRVLLTAGLVNQAATVTLSPDGLTATIDPTANLATGTGYTLRATTGVTDLEGDTMAVQSDSTFTTIVVDTTPPTISSRNPASGATGVSVSVNPTVTFSEPMLLASITSTTVKLTKTSDGTVIPGALSLSSNVVTLDPTSSLSNSTQYTLTILGGGSGVKDSAGNAMTSTSTASFTTIAPSYTVVYNVSGDWWNTLDDSDLLDGLQLTSSSGSGLYGKVIKKATVTLKRTGSGIGTVTCRICALDSYSTVKQNLGTMSGDSITTSSSGAQYTFENATATYAMQLNDCLVIHQDDGDSSNYISVWILEADAWSYGIRVHSNDPDNFGQEAGEEFAAILYT